LVVHVEEAETTIAPTEIGRSLRERLGMLPREEPPPHPHALDLVVEAGDGGWRLRYPRVARGVRWMLLAFALLPAGLFALTSWVVSEYGESRLLWMAWVLAAALLSMAVYIVIVLREEMVARLGEAKLEIAEGLLRFHRPDRRVEQMPLDAIESVELGRQGSAPSIAIVSPERILHLVGLGAEEEREWVRDLLEAAILEAGRVGAAETVQ
jgi:hypothetical protein